MKLHQMPFTDQFQQGTKPLRISACSSNVTVPGGVKRKGTHMLVRESKYQGKGRDYMNLVTHHRGHNSFCYCPHHTRNFCECL